MAQPCKNLIVWQKAMDLVTNVCRVSEAFPKREVYRWTDQIRRAAVSVASKIAEDQAHFSKAEFLHFLRHSSGSWAELETQIRIAEHLEYTKHAEAEALLAQVVEAGKLLNACSTHSKGSDWVQGTGNWILCSTCTPFSQAFS